jgi:predicted nucleotidyltransferase
MSFILDSIRLKEILEGTETVNVDWFSPSFSLDDREDEFSIQVIYENGSAPNMSLVLQISSDNINFADITESVQTISDASGSHIWDIAGSGALYARVKIVVLAGSIDVTRIFYAGKQRH